MTIDVVRARHLLRQSHISLLTSHTDAEASRLQALLVDHVPIDGRSTLEAVLGRLVHAVGPEAPAPKTLDLIGHSTPDGLLRLGDWVIDGESSKVTAFFRNIADLDVLPRIGVTALRLLGCSTAVGARARNTMQIVAGLLGLEVYGTTSPIYNLHYDEHGYGHAWRFLLAAASEGRRPLDDLPEPMRTPRTLDIDSLPLVALDAPHHGRRLVVSLDVARELLALVDRTAGAQMAGLLAIPSAELALPAHQAGYSHVAEVILDGHFLRVYPDGPAQPGIVYPVLAPQHLNALLSRLSTI